MNINGMEIERKFMIAMPEKAFLGGLDSTEIVQTYLVGENGATERVRKRGRDGVYVYTHTIKYKISNMRRREDEREIGIQEYEELLKRADLGRNAVLKTRYCYDYAGALWEIDVYPFWHDKAVMEIELSSEDQHIDYPPDIRIIRELTDDKRYTNAAMAKQIPQD